MTPQTFWLIHASQWPRGNSEYVFLAIAVHRMGRHLFPERPIDPALELAGAWKSTDPATAAADSKPQPKQFKSDPQLEKHRAAYGQPSPAETLAMVSAAAMRVHSAWTFIAQASADGLLKTGIRPLDGGDITPLPASVWKTEYPRYRDRFALCRMNPNAAFSGGIGGLGEDLNQWGYIFVDRDGLDRLTGHRSRIVGSSEYWDSAQASRVQQQKSKPGQKSMEKDDVPLLQEMRDLMACGKATSAEEAARMVADHAPGHGSPASKQHRLAKRFRTIAP